MGEETRAMGVHSNHETTRRRGKCLLRGFERRADQEGDARCSAVAARMQRAGVGWPRRVHSSCVKAAWSRRADQKAREMSPQFDLRRGDIAFLTRS
jgi:hypothetical protein